MTDDQRDQFDEAMETALQQPRDLTVQPLAHCPSDPEALRRHMNKIDLRRRNTPTENLRIDLSTHQWQAGAEDDEPLLDEDSGPWRD